MENARNSFYLAMRNGLAALNPARTLVLRGVQRPGMFVEENESAVDVTPPDVFVLRWTEMAVDTGHSLPLAQQVCEFVYWTEGTSSNGGLDRGRLLDAMDAELVQLVSAQNAAKQNFATQPPAAMATRIFWSDAQFEALMVSRNRIKRTAKVTVFSFEEAADL